MTFLRLAWLFGLACLLGTAGGVFLLVRGDWFGWLLLAVGVLCGLVAGLVVFIVKDFAG